MVATALSRLDFMICNVLVWLAVLIMLVEVQPAAAGWLPVSFLKGFAPNPAPNSRHPSYLTVQTPSEVTADGLPMSAGSLLRAFDQCGGTGGLCTSTSIGFVCGDRPWPGSYCPEDYACSRSNDSYWQCNVIAGRKPTEQQVASSQAGSNPSSGNSKGSVNLTSILTTSHGNISMEDGSYSTVGSGRSSRQHSTLQATGSSVPICGRAHFAGRPVSMCNSSMDGVLVNLPQVATSGAMGDLAGGTSKLSQLLLTILVTAAVAVHALD